MKVRRDIKPVIFVTHNGQANVRDFGVAKLVGQHNVASSMSAAPTVSKLFGRARFREKPVDDCEEIRGVFLARIMT